MKIAIIGASGIIGQHMRLCVPEGVEPVWTRREEDALHVGLDLLDASAVEAFFAVFEPDVVINLAGENRPDVVEANKYAEIVTLNAIIPGAMAALCREHGAHMIQVSTQAVYSGKDGPYTPFSPHAPVNEYGKQKSAAESAVVAVGGRWSIVRPSFVLGVRPMPAVGRQNPLEQMLAGGIQRQASDRWFSCSFARTVARRLWEIALGHPLMGAVNIGIPKPVSRFYLARLAGARVDNGTLIEARQADFGGAPRPFDTTYAGFQDAIESADHDIEEGIDFCKMQLQQRENLTVAQRARELALFTGRTEAKCAARLALGFGVLHNAVSEDFRAANPRDDAELLEWYRTTEAYCWELSAYHADPGFNYAGMCKGVAQRLQTFHSGSRVLCLGDGIGDLTLTLRRAGFDAVYHDLDGSRTSAFAQMRLAMYGEHGETHHTVGWEPDFPVNEYAAVCSFDFLEHVTDVEAWVRAIHRALRPHGLFFAQNAFACGSGPDGAMPMRLARNDRFERDWDPFLFSLGFVQESSNWYRKAL